MPRNAAARGAAELIVQIEDVSRADAPSKVVAETRIPNPRLEPGKAVPFELEVPEAAIEDKGMYSVRAHVDMSGSGEVEEGDLLSTQSYPVITRGYTEEARVEVRQI
jgi:putative lipoprotein